MKEITDKADRYVVKYTVKTEAVSVSILHVL